MQIFRHMFCIAYVHYMRMTQILKIILADASIRKITDANKSINLRFCFQFLPLFSPLWRQFLMMCRVTCQRMTGARLTRQGGTLNSKSVWNSVRISSRLTTRICVAERKLNAAGERWRHLILSRDVTMTHNYFLPSIYVYRLKIANN